MAARKDPPHPQTLSVPCEQGLTSYALKSICLGEERVQTISDY